VVLWLRCTQWTERQTPSSCVATFSFLLWPWHTVSALTCVVMPRVQMCERNVPLTEDDFTALLATYIDTHKPLMALDVVGRLFEFNKADKKDITDRISDVDAAVTKLAGLAGHIKNMKTFMSVLETRLAALEGKAATPVGATPVSALHFTSAAPPAPAAAAAGAGGAAAAAGPAVQPLVCKEDKFYALRPTVEQLIEACKQGFPNSVAHLVARLEKDLAAI
jgi:hypothetical protein